MRLGARRSVEAGGGGGQRGRPAELLKVRGAERGASPRSGRGQLQPHQPPAVVVAVPADEAERFHPVGQLDRAVVADEQVGRQFADGRLGGSGWMRSTSSNWCWAVVRPATAACSWLQRRNRCRATREASRFSYPRSSNDVSTLPHTKPRGLILSDHDRSVPMLKDRGWRSEEVRPEEDRHRSAGRAAGRLGRRHRVRPPATASTGS